MTPDQITELIKVLLDAFKSVFPLLATGLVTYFVITLKNRNDREKDENKRNEVETQREQYSANATDIINRKFEEIYASNTQAQTKLLENERKFAEIIEKTAEERGGLKQQIADLQEQQRQERLISEQRNQNNDKAIGELQNQIALLLEKQAALELKVSQTISERDLINQNLEAKIVELQRAQELLEQTQKEVIRLTEEKSSLESQLRQKDEALTVLQKQLDSPRKRKTTNIIQGDLIK